MSDPELVSATEAPELTAPRLPFIGLVAAAWGFVAFFWMLGVAIQGLSMMAIDSLNYAWTPVHYIVCVVNLVFMAWAEGYRGFQLKFSPRFAARAHYAAQSGTSVQRMLAPLFCMSFFNAPPRRLIAAYALTAMIIGFVVLFHFIPQPWRGALDVGVVAGLIWGIVTTGIDGWRVFVLGQTPAPHEVA